MGTQLPSQKGGGAPAISAHVYCGQMAESIKMPLGMEVGLSPCNFAFDGDPAPPEERTQPPPNFWLMFIVGKRCGQTTGWMNFIHSAILGATKYLSSTRMLTVAPTITSNLYSIVYPNRIADGYTVNPFSDVCGILLHFFRQYWEVYVESYGHCKGSHLEAVSARLYVC